MPHPDDPKRIVRQWTILLFLLRHRYGATLSRLRETTGASRSTIWRDLRALQMAGIPIEEHTVSGERRVSLRATDLPALVLTPLQVQSLALARRLLGTLQGTAILDAYDEILSRLGRPVRPVPQSESEERLATHRRALDAAIAGGRAARIRFVNVGEAAERPRHIDPLGWRLVRSELYLLAFDHDRGAQRSFATSRIRGVELLGPATTRRLDDPHAPLFAATEGLETLPTVEVEVELSPVAAAHLAARPLSAQQVEHRRADGSLRLTAQVAGLWATVDWIVAWGAEVRAVSPPALVEAVTTRLLAALARYETPVQSGD
jgi:predicted DNA-binding transcriptional regulator YafY